jgi:YVTN family beta-propeller protein
MPITLRRKPTKRPRMRGITIAGVTLTLIVAASGAAIASGLGGGFGTDEVDGVQTAKGILLPTNQRVTPVGVRYQINNGRLLSSTLSPNGKDLAALTYEHGTGFLSIIDVKTGAIVQQLGTGSANDPTIGDHLVAADGPLYSPDGSTLWFPQGADLVRFAVGSDGTVSKSAVIALTGPHGDALPSGMVLSADGTKLYVALNGSNTLGVIDTATNSLLQQIPVGIAPRQVVLVGTTAYVSNEGGRPPVDGDTTNLSDGTSVVSNPVTGAVTNGTVSVVDLTAGVQTATIKVGLEPSAMYLHQNVLFVANSNSDSVSVINTANRRVTQTFNLEPLPGTTVGSNPNSITMPDSHHILVSDGRDNALAVYNYNGPLYPVQYRGLIPTDWYPVNAQLDPALGKIVVTNDKGIGARGPESTIGEGPSTSPDTGNATGHNTYDDTGTVTVFKMPSDKQLGALTHQVFLNNDWQHVIAATDPHLAAASKQAPVAIPTTLGAPSKIKHVFLIIKENRTYDQVLGDIGKGDSDPSLTQFGATVTPNQHALANTYGLFDNFYDEGTLSADGHNWLVQADANDYIEKEFGAFYRSYPSLGDDALAYQRNGFLWNAAEQAGNSVSDFGEYAYNINLPATGAPTWADWYTDSQILEGKASGTLPVPTDEYQSTSDVPSVNAINDSAVPTFDTDIPDQYRTDIWEQSFAQAEKTGNLANLSLIAMPQDHTAGTSGKDPFPTAMAADNDLAVGRIISDISHSQFWKDSAVFVLEDDSQNGTDHVDGHRAPLYIASPYAKRGIVDSTYYSQINVVKTIEQILHIQPMNQMDRAAEPMFDAFTNTPNYAPYTTLANQVPLTYGLKVQPAASPQAKALVKAAPQPVVPAAAQSLYNQWVDWSDDQFTSGAMKAEDSVNPAQMNRLTWYASTGWTRPYPGDTRILSPDEVPGRDLPPQELGN